MEVPNEEAASGVQTAVTKDAQEPQPPPQETTTQGPGERPIGRTPMAVPPDEEAAGGAQTAAVKKSAWTKEEDAVLREQVHRHGPQNWAAISDALPGRNHKSCRLRWCQHLDPSVDAARPFTPEEDEKILELHRRYPNKWATIADFLPGRTDNAIKNRWHSVLGKKYHQQVQSRRLPDRTLPLFPLAPGGTRAFHGTTTPVFLPQHLPPVEPGVDLSGACLELFPLAPGDLAEAAGMDVDRGADEPLVELRLRPSTTAYSLAAFKAMVQAARAP